MAERQEALDLAGDRDGYSWEMGAGREGKWRGQGVGGKAGETSKPRILGPTLARPLDQIQRQVFLVFPHTQGLTPQPARSLRQVKEGDIGEKGDSNMLNELQSGCHFQQGSVIPNTPSVHASFKQDMLQAEYV